MGMDWREIFVLVLDLEVMGVELVGSEIWEVIDLLLEKIIKEGVLENFNILGRVGEKSYWRKLRVGGYDVECDVLRV